MPTSRITAIQPNGDKFYSRGTQSDLYPFWVTFEDGTQGSANSKNPQPPYSVGAVMDYQITGNNEGQNKLKISKPGSNFAPSAPAPRAPAPLVQPQPFSRPLAQSRPQPTPEQQANLEPRPSPINGQTVGMAVNNAVEILIHNAKANAAPVDLPSLQARVEDVAWLLIQASKRLESGSIESEPPF